jgi:hypothetical protein
MVKCIAFFPSYPLSKTVGFEAICDTLFTLSTNVFNFVHKQVIKKESDEQIKGTLSWEQVQVDWVSMVIAFAIFFIPQFGGGTDDVNDGKPEKANVYNLKCNLYWRKKQQLKNTFMKLKGLLMSASWITW